MIPTLINYIIFVLLYKSMKLIDLTILAFHYLFGPVLFRFSFRFADVVCSSQAKSESLG